MKVLFISNLFPDAQEANRGLVNARVLRHLSPFMEMRVVAPRPHLSGWWKNEVPRRPLVEDEPFSPIYPLVPYIPKFGSRFNDRLYARRLETLLLKIRTSYPFEVVLCSWLYPDCTAVERLAGQLNFHYVAIAQGSDVHQYLPISVRRSRILSTVNHSSATITRSRELARLLGDAGADRNKLHVVYNGVETNVFKPGDQRSERETLALPPMAKLVLYVGNLLPVKNPGLALESLAKVLRLNPEQDVRLVLIGTGPLEGALRQMATTLGIASKVIWAGTQKPAEVARYLRACDVLCIPSRNEGLPNVLLEALASGTPVAATNVGGISEILCQPELGQLVESENADQMAAALLRVVTGRPDKAQIAQAGKSFSWEDTARSYVNLLKGACASK